MTEPLISVIIPIYNVEAYLARCLDSVINNTYRNLEIICVNDGSPDHCGEILEQYAARDGRIRVITQINQGLSAARNTGMDIAKGDYLYFLDSDDWIHTDAFGILLRTAEQEQADITLGGYQTVYQQDQFDAERLGDIPKAVSVCGTRNAMNTSGFLRDMVWGTLYRREVAADFRFPPGMIYGEDAYFYTLIASAREDLRYAKMDLPLYAYFIRPGSIMRSLLPDRHLVTIRYWIEHLEEFAVAHYALAYIVDKLFFYRMAGRHCRNPETARKNMRKAIKKCLPYCKSCRNLSKKHQIKLILEACFPPIYWMLLVRMDPSYQISADIHKEKYKDAVLRDWEDL